MNPLVLKMLAVGMTVSQLYTKPVEQFRTHFDPQSEQKEVTQILNAGCGFVTKELGAESMKIDVILNLIMKNIESAKSKANNVPADVVDDEIEGVVKENKSAPNATDRIMAKLDFTTLNHAYKQICKGESIENSSVKLDEVISFYNTAMADVKDHTILKDLRLPEATAILDGNGKRFTEVYSDNNRRNWMPISEIPVHVRHAFVAAEDKRFYQHKGIDLNGIIRAFIWGFMNGKQQGGSTITQQVAKNLVVGDDLTFERKMREMLVAARIEQMLSKEKILELYLNYVFLGRSSWGVEMASKSYFGKSVRELTPAQGALLAGLTRSPSKYSPDKDMAQARRVRDQVLGRMDEDKYLPAGVAQAEMKQEIKVVEFESPRTRGAYYFIDEIQREAKRRAKIPSLTSGSYIVKSTVNFDMQRAADLALSDGLAEYEARSGRAAFRGAVGSIADEILKYNLSWKELLPKARSRFYDVQWPLATVLEFPKKGATGIKVGLVDGRIATLTVNSAIQAALKPFDLLFVRVIENKKSLTAKILVPPKVQGAVVVMEAKSGKILAMSGGFSYADSQLNRVTQTARQPGSTLKPFIYLAALGLGYQPNTLIPDVPVLLPPIGRNHESWSPKNYDGGSRGLVTIRQAVEKSLNLPTARIMSEMGDTAPQGLDYVRGITQELGIYKQTVRFYPFVLGSQEARLIDLATAYATVANIGLKPIPHFFDEIDHQDGSDAYTFPKVKDPKTGEMREPLFPVPSIDRVAFYQLRKILEGTLTKRGTGYADSRQDLLGYVAGKTGTSNKENDAWFVGFTNDVVVAVWVGYDSRDIKSSLGARFTGGRVALPIAEKVIRKSFEIFPKNLLAGPPDEIKDKVLEYPINDRSGEFRGGNFLEVFRVGANKNAPVNTRMNILRGDEAAMYLSDPVGEEENAYGTQNLADDDQEGGRWVDQESTSNRQRPYQPGADDQYDLWRLRGRNVDPIFQDYRSPSYRRY
jgi:penicillin-binding protein 1A